MRHSNDVAVDTSSAEPLSAHELARGDSLWGEAEAACAPGPLAQVEMVCSVWGTTDSSRRTLLSSTASCGSTVSRPGPVAARAAFQRHLFGDDLRSQPARDPLSTFRWGRSHGGPV